MTVYRPILWLKSAALVILTAFAALNLLFAVGEIASGDFSGAIHLLPVILVSILAYLAWKWPLLGGILTSFVGITFVIKFLLSLDQPLQQLFAIVLMCAPFLLSGILFLTVAVLARKPALQALH